MSMQFIDLIDASTGDEVTGKAFGDFTVKYLPAGGGALAGLTGETIATVGTFAEPSDGAHVGIKEVNSADPTAGVYQINIPAALETAGGTLYLFFAVSGCRNVKLQLAIPYASFPKRVKDSNAGTITTYLSDGVTALAVQAFTSAGGVDTIDAG